MSGPKVCDGKMIRQLDILWLRSFLRELGLPQKASAKMQKAGQCLPGFEEPFSRSAKSERRSLSFSLVFASSKAFTEKFEYPCPRIIFT